MNSLHCFRGYSLAAAISTGLVVAAAPAVAEPYLFTAHTRAPAATAPNSNRNPSPYSLARPSNPYGKRASELSKPLTARATPPSRSICRRLVRDSRYGYVEVQFVC